MNSASLMFLVVVLQYLPRVSTSAKGTSYACCSQRGPLLILPHLDQCSGRWQMNDKSNIKMTLDWQIDPLTDEFVTEFRTNLVVKGSWHAFGLSLSANEPVRMR